MAKLNDGSINSNGDQQMNKLVQCGIAMAVLSPESSLDTSAARKVFDRLTVPLRKFAGMMQVYRDNRTGRITFTKPQAPQATDLPGLGRFRESRNRDLPAPSPFRRMGK